MRKTGKHIPCAQCGKDFYLPRWREKRHGNYCSHVCHNRALIIPRVIVKCGQCGKSFPKLQSLIDRGLGRNCSNECNLKALIAAGIRTTTTCETLHPRWKGDKVGYFGVHDWMTKHYGQPIGCEVCGTTDSKRTYGWANISREYKRDRKDFKRMCMSCHRKYDGAGKKAWATFLKRQELLSV